MKQHCEEQLPLKQRSFRERTNSPLKYLNLISRPQNYISRSGNQASESKQVCVTRVSFLPLLSRNFDDQPSSNFHRFVILCIC